MSQRILLIDGHALCYRAFYAVQDLRNSRGVPTNAVFGFVNILRKLLKTYGPDHAAACFDTGKETFRRAKFAAYKIQRQPMPEGLADQIAVIKDLLRAYGIPVFEKEGYEADDLIATLVTRFRDDSREIIIASDDKDMYQLIAPGVAVYHSRKDALLGAQETRERFGVGPEHVVDYLALAGDSSDNIPGVHGIGDVTAQKLLSQYGSLKGILAHSGELKGKLQEKIEQGREMALLSYELATLDSKVPLACTLDDIRCDRLDRPALVKLFTDLEFRRLADEFRSPDGDGASAAPTPRAKAIAFSDGGSDVSQCVGVALMTSRAAVIPLLAEDKEGRRILGGCCVATGGVVFRFTLKEIAALKELWQAPSLELTVYDAKPLIKALLEEGITLRARLFDAMLAAYLLKSGQGAFTVEALAHACLGITIPEGDDRPAHEAAALARLQEPLRQELTAKECERLFDEIEMPLCLVLAQMEREGIRLDVDQLSRVAKDCEHRIKAMTHKLHTLAGGEFNLNSPKQLGAVLFEKLKLPVIKRTKTGPSTDEEVLNRLAPLHELPALVLEYRQLAKLKSTYLDALPRMADADGRVRCTFNQAGAETGRLSADHPNVQNIPVRTDIGREIRKAFVARASGWVLVSADYSQMELRLLAHLSADPELMAAFRKGEDIHSYTAALIFDVPIKDVTTQMRYRAKRINFGIVYGMSAFGLAKDLDVSQREAQDFIDRYFHRYPHIRDYMARCEAQAREHGYVASLFGRRRYLPDINSRNPALRQFAERQAINTPLQGTAADLLKASMVAVECMLRREAFEARMVLTVHDELVFDAPQGEARRLAGKVKRIMEDVLPLSVPLDVTLKSGPNWVEMTNL